MKKLLKSKLSKLKFQLGFSPEIENNSNKDLYMPKDKKTVVLISADFELAWAPRYDSSVKNALKFAKEKAATERENIPLILKLCEEYNIPITWATVGHIFLEKCERKNGVTHPEIPEVTSYKNKYWKFDSKDWFEYDPCTDYKKDPLWYGPDIIRLIQKSFVKHEIGNHTFSHIDCRDGVCDPELLRAELRASKVAAEKFGIDLKTFVHPGHTIGNLKVLSDEKFTNFRTDYGNILGYPKKHESGLWELQQTAQFNIRKEWSTEYHIYRYKKIIERSIKANKVCVFWFHPSFDTVMVESIWPEVFKYIKDNEKDIWVTTHSEYINWLDNRSKR